MENVTKIEIMLIAAPVVVYWFYLLFLILTELSSHKGIEISLGRKITAITIVLVPLALLWGLGVFNAKSVDIEASLGIFALPVTYITFVLMLCAPIAAIYVMILLIRQFNAWTPNPARPKYRINSTEDSILAMNAATNFMRDRNLEEEQEQLDREEARRNAEDEEEHARLDRFANPGLYI